MKNAIYFLIILTSFTACKQNVSNETTTEVLTETTTSTVVNDSDVTASNGPTILEQPKTKDELWNEYWTKFIDAIKQTDKKTMLKLSNGDSFFAGGGAETAEEFINYVDKSGFWSDWLSIANNKKVKVTKENNRTIVDDYMIFEFIKGEWIWTGVMGD